MTTKTGWLVGIAVIAGSLAIGVGFAVAAVGGDAQGSATTGDMMGGSSTTTGMMGSSDAGMMGGDSSDGMMGSESMADGMMDGGMSAMMSGVDMDAMHEQMMTALAGKVPPELLARCDSLHDQMSFDGTDRAPDTGHSGHHRSTGSPG